MDNKSFIEQIEDIYSHTSIYFNSNADNYWSKPKSLNGQIGFCILYTAPSYNPDILIIGQNPSNFNQTNEMSDEDMYMMSGRIPEINSYLQHNHKFALKIREVFSSESDKQYLLKSVGMNIWYAQGSKLDQVKMTEDLKDMKEFCKKQTFKMINILRPKTIFSIGFKVFDELNNKDKHKDTLKFGKYRIYEEGELGNIPVYGCAHLTGAYIPDEPLLDGARQCLLNIKEYLNDA